MDDYAAYAAKLRVLLGDKISVGIGGQEWVINITPSNATLPPGVTKLVGVQLKKKSTLISLPVREFDRFGIGLSDEFFGDSKFETKGSYMMLRVNRRLEPQEISPCIMNWLDRYRR